MPPQLNTNRVSRELLGSEFGLGSSPNRGLVRVAGAACGVKIQNNRRICRKSPQKNWTFKECQCRWKWCNSFWSKSSPIRNPVAATVKHTGRLCSTMPPIWGGFESGILLCIFHFISSHWQSVDRQPPGNRNLLSSSFFIHIRFLSISHVTKSIFIVKRGVMPDHGNLPFTQ